MITGLHIGNFKAFKETQRIPVRPLTLLFGANSAGKSSALHGLLAGAHALKTGDLDVRNTAMGGDVLDLGGFDQFAHCGGKYGDVVWGAELDLASTSRQLKEMFAGCRTLSVLADFGRERAGSEVEALVTRRIRVETDGASLIDCECAHVSALAEIHWWGPLGRQASEDYALAPQTRSGSGTYWLHGLNLKHPAIIRWLEHFWKQVSGATLTKGEWRTIEAEWETICDWRMFVKSLLPTALNDNRLLGFDEIKSARFPKGKGKKGVVEFAMQSVGGFIDLLFHLIQRAVSEPCENIMYLGPLRTLPPRRLIFPLMQSKTADGSHAWQVVAENTKIRARINKWLADPEKFNTALELVTRDWRAEGGGRMVEILLRDRDSKTFVSHRDVGVGVSQVLPMIVAAMATENHIHAVEQPELHLHPALQAELGDLFIESALGKRKNTFLLETHSEHLLLRIMRRMRETAEGRLPRGTLKVRPQDVAVLYVQRDGACSIVREMPLNERGELLKQWPGGFFEEGLKEVLSHAR